MRQIKELLDEFDTKGVQVQESSCDFASLLVIANKKDGGIRMTVDCRKVNMQAAGDYCESTSLPTNFISMFGWTIYFAKVDNLWGISSVKAY